MDRTNQQRAETAYAALVEGCRVRGELINCDEDALYDLLADLRHFCDANDLNFAEIDRRAYQAYLAEVVVSS
jgi:hypothetical protein